MNPSSGCNNVVYSIPWLYFLFVMNRVTGSSADRHVPIRYRKARTRYKNARTPFTRLIPSRTFISQEMLVSHELDTLFDTE